MAASGNPHRTPSPEDRAFLSKIRDTGRMAAEKASKILLEGLTRPIRVSFKGRINLMTEIDLASEQTIIETISSEFPEHGFLAEESGARQGKGEAENRWIIDPLDGTTNYAHRYPCFSISIAFESRGIVQYGIVLDPLRNQAFEAIRGEGARLNGEALRVSPESDPEKCLLATGFSYSHADSPVLKNMRFFEGFSRECQGIRRSGSAAIDLCHVALGALDGFWELDLSPWDTAAGALIVLEAGGSVTDGTGLPFLPGSPVIIASNGHIHDWMLSMLRKASGEPAQR